ncbi:glucose-1-phosphate adenylyltransferase [Bacillus sp. SORGH_AS 510]|uniref:sugar phosphate nucleotidyltransferase n=1 Tax=Bacillus sp. SORGH_AS_0510 TaxID=3041771 RepID=UPI0027885BE9|nr:sugar phosphate nucleotidyltransferase [Bacillus sp. SORGH_AS_0510]MDQ1144635.1 glucose-1-phosphate adenylyltransferase [Bacillus sp. SORGH_AS_0510]
MKRKLLGVIDATTYHEDLEDLLTHRSLAALPFAGRYRIIDFVLSNMVNSGIRSVAIFPKMQYRSLMDHLGSGKNWDLNRKRDGLFFFPSPIVDNDGNKIGSFEHFAANLDFFYRSTQEYAIISNCHTVFNMTFHSVLNWHRENGCDITEIHHKDGRPMEMYLIKTSLLIKLIETRNETGYTCMKDVVNDLHNDYTICRYNYEGYAVMIDSIENYFATSMNLLKPEVWKNLFIKEQPIITKVKDEPPTKYVKGSEVKNAMIANGCFISGSVENSIVSRGVKIGKGAVIKNCIIMQKCQIEDNCYLDSVILDKDVKVEAGTRLIGTARAPYVIRKGTKQGALMNS